MALLLPPALDIVPDELLGVLLQDLVNLVHQVVHLFLELLPLLGHAGLGLRGIIPLRRLLAPLDLPLLLAHDPPPTPPGSPADRPRSRTAPGSPGSACGSPASAPSWGSSSPPAPRCRRGGSSRRRRRRHPRTSADTSPGSRPGCRPGGSPWPPGPRRPSRSAPPGPAVPGRSRPPCPGGCHGTGGPAWRCAGPRSRPSSAACSCG